MSVLDVPLVDYYYDLHPTEEDLMGQNPRQYALNSYLSKVLDWLYYEQDWYVVGDVNLYMTDNPQEQPLVPDLAVFKGIHPEEVLDSGVRSLRVQPPEVPAPAVVIEIASHETWKKDLQEKPGRYARMGVGEYVLHDPQPRPDIQDRLRMWRNQNGRAVKVMPDERGWIWSEELASWLVVDDWYLRLCEPSGRIRFTEAEAERTAKEAERAEKEAERAEKEAERAEKEAERAEKEAERAAKERALALLREMGVDISKL